MRRVRRVVAASVFICAVACVVGIEPAWGEQDSWTSAGSKSGPWGKLEYQYIYLEAPENLLALYPLPATIPLWTFPGATRESLIDLFRRAGLPDDLRARLLAPDAVLSAGSALRLHPTVGDLEAMTQKARGVIYRELARWKENPHHYDPVLIPDDDLDAWLKDTDVSPEIKAKIARLTYRRGDTLAFSDVEALMSYAGSDREARVLFRTLTRIRTMMVRVQIDGNTSLQALAAYWSAGFRRKDILPLLQSIAEKGSVRTIDLVHLLPPIARKLLYTYPTSELAINGRMPDCHWTSLNFFNYNPENLFLDTKLIASRVLQNYSQVKPPYRYGDILFVMNNETGEATHSCVYLAENLVFTKNGGNLLAPWILMTLDDIRSLYLKDRDAQIIAYRLNPQDATGDWM